MAVNEHHFDLVVRNATIVDGSDQPLDMTPAERLTAFGDFGLRDALFDEACEFREQLEQLIIKRSLADSNQVFVGRSLGELANGSGKRFSDVFIDVALADDLETAFALENYIHADMEVVTLLLDSPVVQIGAGDAGAHIGSFAGAGDTTYLLERFVRGLRTMTLARAVQRLTSDIAREWRITDRGEIAVGKFADLVLFDADRVARGDEIWVDDVPGGSGRYVRHPDGVDLVIVNGTVLVDHGVYTGNTPGRLI